MVLTVGLRDREAGSTGLGGRDDGARWHLDLVVLAEELELAVVAADGARDVDREQACKSHAVTSGVCSVSREDGQGGHKAITDGTDGRTDGGGEREGEEKRGCCLHWLSRLSPHGGSARVSLVQP